MIPVSVVVMTRNEAANLPHCLAALDRFAEVFVADSPGDDGTADIARAWGARVVPFVWDGRPPRKKQWCLDHLPFAHEWVFFVDADEAPTAALAEEVAALMAAGPRAAGYWVTGRPVFLGRTLRFGAVNRKLALFDRTRARFPDVDDRDVPAMWEVEGHYQPVVDGPLGAQAVKPAAGAVAPPRPQAAVGLVRPAQPLFRLGGGARRRRASGPPRRRRAGGAAMAEASVPAPAGAAARGVPARLRGAARRAGRRGRAAPRARAGVLLLADRREEGRSAPVPRQSFEPPSRMSPPSALTKSKVRLRTDGSAMR